MDPLGSISLSQENLRQSLADVDAWRTLCAATTHDDAAAKIHMHGLPKPTNGVAHTREELIAFRPYAVIWTKEMQGFRRQLSAVGDGYEYASDGQLVLRLERNCGDEVSDEPSGDANLDWSNVVGQIVDGLCALAGKPGYMAFDSIGILNGPYWSHPQSKPTHGLLQGVELAIQWRGL